jgi:hypothetical protein
MEDTGDMGDMEDMEDMGDMEDTGDMEAIWVKATEEVATDAIIAKKPHTTVEAAAEVVMDITHITGLSAPMTRIIIPT